MGLICRRFQRCIPNSVIIKKFQFNRPRTFTFVKSRSVEVYYADIADFSNKLLKSYKVILITNLKLFKIHYFWMIRYEVEFGNSTPQWLFISDVNWVAQMGTVDNSCRMCLEVRQRRYCYHLSEETQLRFFSNQYCRNPNNFAKYLCNLYFSRYLYFCRGGTGP